MWAETPATDGAILLATAAIRRHHLCHVIVIIVIAASIIVIVDLWSALRKILLLLLQISPSGSAAICFGLIGLLLSWVAGLRENNHCQIKQKIACDHSLDQIANPQY